MAVFARFLVDFLTEPIELTGLRLEICKPQDVEMFGQALYSFCDSRSLAAVQVDFRVFSIVW